MLRDGIATIQDKLKVQEILNGQLETKIVQIKQED
jgi:hypothetical protein